MRLTAIRALTIFATLIAMSGCQTAPRFAWWKREKAPEDTSVVARSAAPPLPSTQSKPQAVSVEGLTPAAPPSSANLAATAGTQPPAPALTIPTTSSATVANAPPAKYPTTTVSPRSETPTIGATVAAPIVAASVPPTGPYNPTAYQPASAALAAAPAVVAAPAVADRYGIGPVGGDRAVAPSAAIQGATVDRYAMPAAAHAEIPPSGAPTSQSLPIPRANPPLSPIAASTSPSATSPGSTTTVQLASPAGQYRPGGTSSYTISSPAAQHIEVASRPTQPAPANPAPQESAPTGNSVPWTPPVTTSPGTAPGTSTY